MQLNEIEEFRLHAMRMSKYTRREPKDGMTNTFILRSLQKDRRYCYIILG